MTARQPARRPAPVRDVAGWRAEPIAEAGRQPARRPAPVRDGPAQADDARR